MFRHSRARTFLILSVTALSASASAQSVYQFSIDTSSIRGKSGKIVFDLVSSHLQTNRADIYNFGTDGTLDLPETQGGITSGDLIAGLNPALFTRIGGDSFFNELAVKFNAFGDGITFTVNASETPPKDGESPDTFAVYLLDAEGVPVNEHAVSHNGPARYHPSGTLGDPDFLLSISGERGGAVKHGRPFPIAQQVPVTVHAASRPDDPNQPLASFSGTLVAFCTRRCAGQSMCMPAEYGISQGDGAFLRFDDLGNLKAKVVLVENNKDGQTGVRVNVLGVNQSPILQVREISIQ